MKKMMPFVFLVLLVCGLPVGISGEAGLKAGKKMDSGIVFKAPEATDSYNHAIFERMLQIKGSEIYLNWSDIEKTEGVYDWSVIDKWAEKYDSLGKKISVSVSSASFAINDSPAWLFNDYNVRRIAKGYWLNFEKPGTDYIINDAVVSHVTRGYGKYALRSTRPGSIRTDPFQHELYSSNGYSIQFDYDAAEDATLVVSVASESSPDADKVFEWDVKAGSQGSKTAEFIPVSGIGDYTVQIGTSSGSAILDNINIVEMRPGFFVGNLTFPNYFDPVFMEKYGNFVQAFAAKYRDDDRVDLIYVGGFGRWEELTLCNDAQGELFSLEDQWLSYGYSDSDYIEHVKDCADLYKKQFGGKNLMMTIAGFKGGDNFKNQMLLDWKISQYVANKGIVIKYNGWQERCTEWNNESNPAYYTMMRHKYDPDSMLILEQGAQVNNVSSNIIGHPVSLMNKAIAYGADYFWIYNNDLKDRYFTRYVQYLNESAGGVLNTKLFARFMQFDYYSAHAKKSFQHYNLTYQIYQNQDRSGTKSDYVLIGGEYAAATNPQNQKIVLSIDDRIKAAGTYSSFMNLDYLDSGTDTVSIYVQTDKGLEELETWTKTGTEQWRTRTFDARSFTNTSKGGSTDSFGEIVIEDNGDGIERIRGIEIDYVPADAFLQTVAAENAPAAGEKMDVSDGISFEIMVPADGKIQTLSIPLMCSEINEISSASILVEALTENGYKEIAKKDCFMPEELLWVDVLLGDAAMPSKLRVTIQATKGTVYAASKGDAPGYRLMRYDSGEPQALKADEQGNVRIGLPFDSLLLGKKENPEAISVYQILPDGSEKKVQATFTQTAEDGKKMIVLEPATAGRFRIEGLKQKNISFLPLVRRQEATAPRRELFGETMEAAKDLEWQLSDGFYDVRYAKTGITARIGAANAWAETVTPFSITPKISQFLDIVIRNSTSASLAKLYWKSSAEGYNEKNSVFIPVIANDTQYREYSYNIGYEKPYMDSTDITGFKLVPAYGNLQAGEIAIAKLDIREGFEAMNAYNEPLLVENLENYVRFARVKEDHSLAIAAGIAVAAAVASLLALVLYIAKGKRKKKAD